MPVPSLTDFQPSTFKEYLQLEPEATGVRIFNNALVTGTLHTPAYTRGLAGQWESLRGLDGQAAEHQERRRERLGNLSIQGTVLLGEEVLARQSVSDREAHLGQLAALRVRMQEGGPLGIRIVPFEAGIVVPGQTIAQLDGERGPLAIYHEDSNSPEMPPANGLLKPGDPGFETYQNKLNQLEQSALSPAASMQRVDAYLERI
jgi:hypothetical protein